MKKEKLAILVGALLIIAVGAVTFVQVGFLGKNKKDQNLEDSDYSTYYKTIDAKDVLERNKNGKDFQLIDIDNRLDYEFEHVIDSINVPYEEFDTNLIYPDKNVVLIMRERDRDVLVDISKKIKKAYDLEVYYLAGGVSVWNSEGIPTVSWGNPALSIDQFKVSYISTEELNRALNEDGNFQLIDLRDKNAYEEAKIPGAVNIPLEDLERRRNEVSVSRPVIFYSDNDVLSFQASVRIYDMKLLPSSILKGGINKWNEEGYTLN